MMRSISTLTFLFTFILLGCDSTQEKKKKQIKVNGNREFYFVRHGKTPQKRKDILTGPRDIGLDPTGVEQAKKAGEKLKAILAASLADDSFGTKSIKNNNGGDSNTDSIGIVTSPMKRATQTAEIISGITHFQIFVQKDGLKEFGYGGFRLAQYYTTVIPSDAETSKEFKKRVMKALQEVLDENQGTVIIVSHQKVFGCISRKLTGNLSKISKGGVARFTTCNDGKTWTLEILEG